jgi:hypothetical protein
MMGKHKFKKRRPYQRTESPRQIYKEMTTRYVDVLQNIESAIVAACDEHETIDDRIIAAALRASIEESQPTDSPTTFLFDTLKTTRLNRPDVSDEIWTKGLKVVLESVRTHSDRNPGDTDYLDFIRSFL